VVVDWDRREEGGKREDLERRRICELCCIMLHYLALFGIKKQTRGIYSFASKGLILV